MAASHTFTDAFPADTKSPFVKEQKQRIVVGSDQRQENAASQPPQSDWTARETSQESTGEQREREREAAGEAVDSLTKTALSVGSWRMSATTVDQVRVLTVESRFIN